MWRLCSNYRQWLSVSLSKKLINYSYLAIIKIVCYHSSCCFYYLQNNMMITTQLGLLLFLTICCTVVGGGILSYIGLLGGGFCPGGFCPEGILSGWLCPGGFFRLPHVHINHCCFLMVLRAYSFISEMVTALCHCNIQACPSWSFELRAIPLVKPEFEQRWVGSLRKCEQKYVDMYKRRGHCQKTEKWKGKGRTSTRLTSNKP